MSTGTTREPREDLMSRLVEHSFIVTLLSNFYSRCGHAKSPVFHNWRLWAIAFSEFQVFASTYKCFHWFIHSLLSSFLSSQYQWHSLTPCQSVVVIHSIDDAMMKDAGRVSVYGQNVHRPRKYGHFALGNKYLRRRKCNWWKCVKRGPYLWGPNQRTSYMCMSVWEGEVNCIEI